MKSYSDFLLVSDMDGTLISTDDTVSEDNKKAIKKFVAAGGNFAVATGRTPTNVRQFLDGIAINVPCIFFNGSMLYDMDAKQVMKLACLEGEVWRAFAAACLREFPTACIEVYTENNCYILSDKKNDDPRLAVELHRYEHASLEVALAEKWLKFFIYADKEVLVGISRLAKRQGIDKISTSFYSSPVYLEFVGKNVSKGDMLEVLRNLPTNKGRFVVAAGDYPNDNEMLQRADCGVAPLNAASATKAVADCTAVSCNDSLLAHIINDIIPKYF